MTSAASVRPLSAWFDEAKLGVMVVWTPAAVPAFAPITPKDFEWEELSEDDATAWVRDQLPFAEMYLNQMHIASSATARHHTGRYGDLPYDSFVGEFLAGQADWDPEPWAELFARAGIRYVVLVVKHQDGFLLWPSAHPNPQKSRWQSERDIAGEFADAVRARGMRFGVLYSSGLDFTFVDPPTTDYEELPAAILNNHEYAGYVDAHWRELITRYEPSILWNDAGYPPAADPGSLVAWYRDAVPDGVTNDRFGAVVSGSDEKFADFATLEYQRDYERDAPTGRKWESTRGLGSSFGYNRMETDADYTSATELVHELVDAVARGGNFLPAVGPTATGKIPWAQARRLLELGWWLRLNGAAIYSTRPWTRPAGVTDEGLQVRYTQSKDAVHAIVLGTPDTAEITLDIVIDGDSEVALEGDRGTLQWQTTPHGVRIRLPEIPDPQPALSLRITPASAVHPVPAT